MPGPLDECAITDALTNGAVQSAADDSGMAPSELVALKAAHVPLPPATTTTTSTSASARSAVLGDGLTPPLLRITRRPDPLQLEQAEQEGRNGHQADQPVAGVRVHKRVAELPHPQLHAADATAGRHAPALHGVVGV